MLTRDHTVFRLSTSGMKHTCLNFPAAKLHRPLAGIIIHPAEDIVGLDGLVGLCGILHTPNFTPPSTMQRVAPAGR